MLACQVAAVGTWVRAKRWPVIPCGPRRGNTSYVKIPAALDVELRVLAEEDLRRLETQKANFSAIAVILHRKIFIFVG